MNLIHKLDMVILGISFFSLMIIIGYASPLVISPVDNFQTSESEILFKIENADTLLIDDNFEFTTPDEYKLREGLKLKLEPGVYYWKAKGIFGSEIRTLTLNSRVDLQLRKRDETYEVFNAGNVRLDVEVYNGTNLVERIKVDTGEIIETEGTKFVGEMSDE
jgi:hypothetical protein